MNQVIRKYIILSESQNTNSNKVDEKDLFCKERLILKSYDIVKEINGNSQTLVKSFNHDEDFEMKTVSSIDKNNVQKGLQQFIIYGYNAMVHKQLSGAIVAQGQNIMIFPHQFHEAFIEPGKDLRVMNHIKKISYSGSSLSIPIIKNNKNHCRWVQYGNAFEGEDDYDMEIKTLNFSNVVTTAKCTHELLDEKALCNEMFRHMLREIDGAICKAIFSSKYVDNDASKPRSIFDVDKSRKKTVKIQEERSQSIWEILSKTITEVESVYRENSCFFLSREFFNLFIADLAKETNVIGHIICANTIKIMGYSYYIVEEIDGAFCIFGDLKSAYLLAMKEHHKMIRDEVTEKGLIKVSISWAAGGMVVNQKAISIIELE